MRGGGARSVALDVLEAVERRGAYANLALDAALARSGLSSVERGFATELAFGVIRRQLTLDWLLTPHLKRPDKLESWVRNLLRLGVYQLYYLDRVPARAAVNESVELAKRRGHPGIVGLVNGVLRAVTRGKGQERWPDQCLAPAEYLAVRGSHPEWLAARWLERLGFAETEALLACDNQAPPVVLRVNRLRGSRDELLARLAARGVTAEPSGLSPDGVILSSTGEVGAMPEVADGLAQVQDEASMLVGRLVAPRAGERLLDAAAAPGGKATHLAELMGDDGTLLACDVHPPKLRFIEENAARLGLKAISTRSLDAGLIGSDPELAGGFDRVLLDAPCSGLGVLRRRADARWRKAPGDIPALADLQERLLASVATAVRPGGRLVYSTCSTEIEEGESVVERFAAEHHGFHILTAADVLESEGGLTPEVAAQVSSDRFMRLWPQRHGCDGFFGAVLEREK